MEAEKIKEILLKHKKWGLDEEGGERADLRGANLRGAYLSGANLRGADLRGANLRDAYLRDAYLRGAYLSGANLRGANLSGANLRDAYLSGANLRGANLSGANLRDAYLSGANLRDADLRDADLRGANLRDAYLSGANLRGAYLPKILEVENLFIKIKAAIESGGKLEMASWHGCKTTHCMGGWVINLTGEVGRVAENLLGTPCAAALIINESCAYLKGKVPNFYSENKEAMNFINECSKKEL